MTGKRLIILFVIFITVFAAGLYYANSYAYYKKTEHAQFNIAGLDVQNYTQIDASSSPIKFRACFELKGNAELYGEEGAPTPLVAPHWFDCFNAKQLTTDLEEGRVNAVAYDFNQPYGVTSYIIAYPDGRAFAWRQLNECGESKFKGEDPPEYCEEPTTQTDTESQTQTSTNENNNG